MISQQNVLDEMSHHIRDLHSVVGSSALESMSDSESSSQNVRKITMSNALTTFLEASSHGPDADPGDTSTDKSYYHKEASDARNLPWICNHEIR